MDLHCPEWPHRQKRWSNQHHHEFQLQVVGPCRNSTCANEACLLQQWLEFDLWAARTQNCPSCCWFPGHESRRLPDHPNNQPIGRNSSQSLEHTNHGPVSTLSREVHTQQRWY